MLYISNQTSQASSSNFMHVARRTACSAQRKEWLILVRLEIAILCLGQTVSCANIVQMQILFQKPTFRTTYECLPKALSTYFHVVDFAHRLVHHFIRLSRVRLIGCFYINPSQCNGKRRLICSVWFLPLLTGFWFWAPKRSFFLIQRSYSSSPL